MKLMNFLTLPAVAGTVLWSVSMTEAQTAPVAVSQVEAEATAA